jgi:putative glutamine amidotransferase
VQQSDDRYSAITPFHVKQSAAAPHRMFHVEHSPGSKKGRGISTEHGCVNIGLSYDYGTPKYRLYAGALLAAGDHYGTDVNPIWIAGREQSFNEGALEAIDGLVLTGGGDVEPARYGFTDANGVCEIQEGRDDVEWRVLRIALERRIPILAICRGMQLLNVFLGGSLVPDLPTADLHRLEDTRRHLVDVVATSGLALLSGVTSAGVTSSHHQAVDRLGNGLVVAARHADGTTEVIEWRHPMRKPWLAAVQWHPERMGLDEPLSGSLYRGFLDAVALSRD